jgi:hypothetical protein
VLQVTEPVDPDAIDMGRQKDRDSEGDIIVDVAGRRIETGDKSHKITDNNIKGNRPYQGEEMLSPVVADIFLAEVQNPFSDRLHEVLKPGRDELQGFFDHKGGPDKKQRCKKRIGYIMGHGVRIYKDVHQEFFFVHKISFGEN